MGKGGHLQPRSLPVRPSHHSFYPRSGAFLGDLRITPLHVACDCGNADAATFIMESIKLGAYRLRCRERGEMERALLCAHFLPDP